MCEKQKKNILHLLRSFLLSAKCFQAVDQISVFLWSHHLLVGATQTHSSPFTVQLCLSSVSQKLSLAFEFNFVSNPRSPSSFTSSHSLLGVLIYQFVVFFSKHSICLCFCLKEFCTLSQKIVIVEHFRSKRFKMKGKQHAKRG